jgi:hypothetical protein
MAGWGGTTITLTGGATPFSDDYMTVHDVMLWNPTGDGRANLSQLKTDGAMQHNWLADPIWHYGAGPVATTYGSHADINSPIHDPDVRGLYPESSCRTTDAKLVVDVNMGGGAATIRAAPFTKDMGKMTPGQIRAHLLADRHVVTVIDIGGSGATDKRICFPKWVQSRKAVGEFTSAKIVPPSLPTDDETGRSGMGALYTDEFCYGGWVFIFENISPAAYGSVPYVRMVSVVEIQVQLSLSDNHLKEVGKGKSFEKHLRDHEKLAGNPSPPTVSRVAGSAVAAAMKTAGNTGPTPAPKTKAKTGKGRGTVAYQGPPGHARRGPNLRGSLPQQQQQQKSQAAKKNRAQTAAQVQRLAEQYYTGKGKGKGLTAWQKLGELLGGSADPQRIALKSWSTRAQDGL